MNSQLIISLLGHVMAQNDPSFLQYYIKRSDILSVLLDPERNFTIINSPRGSGKSGLLIASAAELTRNNVASHLVIRKFYTDIIFPDGLLSIDRYVSFWKNTILGWIVESIGNQIGFAWTDDTIAAVESAQHSGSKERGVVGALLKRLKFRASPIERAEYDPHLTQEQSFRIVRDSKMTFWVMLDEMDDNYDGSEIYNHRLVSLLQACSVIAYAFKNVKVRLTIRPHVMTILRLNYEKVQTYWQDEVSIAWKSEELKEILARRIRYFQDNNYSAQAVLALDPRQNSIYEVAERAAIIGRYFDDFDMSFKVDGKSDYRALGTLSFGRPRWMLEFCHLALRNAEGGRATVISFQKAIHDYGTNRITFVIAEFKHQFPYLKKLINTFTKHRKILFGHSLMLRDFIIEHVIDAGVIGQPPQAASDKDALALELANALYMIEFLRAKQGFRDRDSHRFIYFTEHPELLATWPSIDNLEWHMHPAYAKALTIDQTYTFRKGSSMREIGIYGEESKRKRISNLARAKEMKKLDDLYSKMNNNNESPQ